MLTSSNRKVHQRAINRVVRALNRNVYNDDVWRGRFVMRQTGSPQMYRFEDGSGSILMRVTLVCLDKLTGNTYTETRSDQDWLFGNGSKVWQMMNTAIIEKFDVWGEDLTPYERAKMPEFDFRKKSKR